MQKKQKFILFNLALFGALTYSGSLVYYANLDETNFNDQANNDIPTQSAQVLENEAGNSSNDACIFEMLSTDKTQYLPNNDFSAIPKLTPLEYLYFYNLHQRLDFGYYPNDFIDTELIIKNFCADTPELKTVLNSTINNTLDTLDQSKSLDEFLYRVEAVLLAKDADKLFEAPQDSRQSFDLEKDCITPSEYRVLYHINTNIRVMGLDHSDTIYHTIHNLSIINQSKGNRDIYDIPAKTVNKTVYFSPEGYADVHYEPIKITNKTVDFAKKYISEYYAYPDKKEYLAYLAKRLYTPQETLDPVIHKTNDDFDNLSADDYIFINSVLNGRFGDTPYWDLVCLATVGSSSEEMKKTSEKFIQKYLQTENRLDFFKDLERMFQTQKEQQKQSSHKSNETLKTSYIRNRAQHING